MKKLLVFFLCALHVAAQSTYNPRKAMDAVKAATAGHYGAFTITQIPKTCKHPRVLFGEKVCRIYVTYPSGRITSAHPLFMIEDWTGEGDHSNSNDTIYHVGLIKPTSQGVYIEGRPGHKIWWQVNNP